MKKFYKIASPVLGGIGSLAMIFYAIHLFKSVAEATGWAAVGIFLLGAILISAGLRLFFKVEKALERI